MTEMTKIHIKTIKQFTEQYEFLNNDYFSPMWYGGLAYPSLSHAFEASRTWDVSKRKEIALATLDELPELALRLVTHRKWSGPAVMEDLLRLKFGSAIVQSPEFMAPMRNFKLLAQTGKARLEFHNKYHDNYWGICDCGDKSRCENPKNLLGHALEGVRENLHRKISQYSVPRHYCQHCGKKVTKRILYSVEFVPKLKYFCNDQECADIMISEAMRESSDKIVIDYAPDNTSVMIYIPKEGEFVTKEVLVNTVEPVTDKTEDVEPNQDELDWMMQWGEMGVAVDVDRWKTQSTTTTTNSDRKYESVVIKC